VKCGFNPGRDGVVERFEDLEFEFLGLGFFKSSGSS
jgi:hypothetical protein